MEDNKNRALCWMCEKPIKGGLLSPYVKTTSGDASACDKCATYKYEVCVVDEIFNGKNIKMLSIEEVKIK